ncbi:M43 family zinc metalloprotease [Neolewinella antarctica]|uniref:Uncharacterized protein n=1 Tax=Neolewinella antarctica TaxID=442734 RepID=A0ABX0XFU7_9BACT|nr:M43 family zinc metalloprotease [Neolewinella antarctica]NJC27756.1 hypothetical protein [Neolewinella antarctica]
MQSIYTRFLFLLLALTGLSFTAQAQRTCGSMDLLEQQIQADPGRAARLEALENFTKKFEFTEGEKVLRTIPVVVHVVARTNAENISLAQIQSQIDVLNDDFRRLNTDRDGTWNQAADSEIEFCLATVDPNGNATGGVLRQSTTRTQFGRGNDNMKFTSTGGSDAWPAADYMNMWTCNIGEGTLGFAQFPGGPAATDGVVMDYRYFGTIGTAQAPFNLGRTATHEVGHYLNLRHIWGDGGCNRDDFVSDTPGSDGPNYGCATGVVKCNSVDMVQNYMDYSDDACMNLFTTGQKARMQAALTGARASLLNSIGCGTPNGGGGGGPTVCNDTDVTLTLTTDQYASETSWTLSGPNGTVATSGTLANNSTSTETFCLPDGCYEFTINDSFGDGICCQYGNGSFNLSGGGVSESGGSFASSDVKTFCIGGGDTGGGACQDFTITEDNFEANYGNWNDGGSDCVRSRTRPVQGGISVYLRDNTNTSVLTSDALDLTGFEELTVDFSYLPFSMEPGEDFWLQVDNGSGFQTVATWASGTDFVNNTVYNESVTLTGDFGNNVRVRFRCDASANSDYVHLDNLVLSGCSNGSFRELNKDAGGAVVDAESDEAATELEYDVFPNPAKEIFTIRISEEGFRAQLTNVAGKALLSTDLQVGSNRIEAGHLPQGMYLLILEGGDGVREVSKVVLR